MLADDTWNGIVPLERLRNPYRPRAFGYEARGRHTFTAVFSPFGKPMMALTARMHGMTHKKKAVCIGTNYPDTDVPLAGCVNDANDMADLLEEEGYEVVRLLGHEATKVNIITALTVAVASMRPRHQLVTFFSGHGTWAQDTSDPGVLRRNEAICPADFEISGLILDSEIQRILREIPRRTKSLFIVDSGFSAAMNHGHIGTVLPGTAKFVSPSMFSDIPEDQVTEIEGQLSIATPSRLSSAITACQDYEFAYDGFFTGPVTGYNRPNGALTKALFSTYSHGVSLGSWFAKASEQLPNKSYPQTPRLLAQPWHRKYTSAL